MEPGDVRIVALDGEIDLSNADRVGAELISDMPRDSVALVVDVSGLWYLDSSGISLVFELARALQARRQSLVLVVPDDHPLQRLFEVTRLRSAVPIAPDVDSARGLARQMADDAPG